MKKIFLLIAIAPSFCAHVFAQTNPSVQTLPYSQNFGTATFTSLPAGTAAWTVSVSPSGTQGDAESSTNNGNSTVSAATTAQTTGGCYGYATSSNGRFYIQTDNNIVTGSDQLACAINTVGWTSVQISYDVEMISPMLEATGIVLQYRVGTSGSWTTISGSVYLHSNSDRSAGNIDNFTSLSLPSAVNNNAVVQLRWATWKTSGTRFGKSSGIAIDNISVTATPQTTGYFRSKKSGDWNDINTWQASADNVTWVNAVMTPKYTANTITVRNGHNVTLTATDTIDQVVVEGKLIYADVAGSTLRINNGTGVDLLISNRFEDLGPNAIDWAGSATWSMGNHGGILRTRSTSADGWRDNYDGGISTIPAGANWTLRKTGSDDPEITSGGMYYPTLSIENNTGSTWATTAASSLTGSSAPPVVKGDLDIGGAGTGVVSFLNDNTNASAVLVKGTLVVESGSTLRSEGTGFEVQGDLVIDGTISYGAGNATFIFSGSHNQNIYATGVFPFNNVQLNKASTLATVTLQNPATVAGTFTFTNGYLNTTATNILTFDNGSSVTAANDSSFVNGPVEKIGNAAFAFPTGKNTNYQPVSISAPSNAAADYVAEYFHADPSLGSAHDVTIDSVSTCEYWTLNNVGTAYPVYVTLGWNGQSCMVDPGAENMHLTEWDGAKWIDLGNSSGIAAVVTSDISLSFFGSFSLAQKGISLLGESKYFALLSGDSIITSDTAWIKGYAGAAHLISSKVLGDSTFVGTSKVTNALADLSSAISYCSGRTGTVISGALGGQSLSQGVYEINGNGIMSGTLNLTGDSSSIYIFNITDSLKIESMSILNIGDVRPNNIYWNVSNSVVIESTINFSGIIMAGNFGTTNLFNAGQVSLLCLGNIVLLPTDYSLGDNSFSSQDYLYLSYQEALLTCTTSGCNLICNPSFENYTPGPSPGMCNLPFLSITYSNSWLNPNISTPDYYNACNTAGGTGNDIPSNFLGNQACNSLCTPTNAYAGIVTYAEWGEWREYITGNIPTALIAGQSYYFEMQVSRADRMQYASNNFGAYFSATAPASTTFGVLPFVPQVEYAGTPVYNDFAWTTLRGTFVATGGEKYVTIGNFRSDAATIVADYVPTAFEPYAYYYLDNVFLVPMSVNAGSDINLTSCIGGTHLNANSTTCASCAGAIPGVTYTWSPSTGLSATNIPNPVANPTSTTTYTVTLHTPWGGSATDEVTVTVAPGPTVTVNSPTICAGDLTVLTADGADSYSWSPNVTFSYFETATVFPTTTTTYTVTGTDANGCTNTAVSTVTVNAIPTITVNSPTICVGQTANLTASGGVSYTWSAGATSTGTNTAAASPSVTTTYTVTGTDANGCTKTAVSTVTVNSLPTVTVNSTTICSGQTAALTASGGVSYTWSTGATSTGTNTANAAPSSTTSYTVTGTNSNGCTNTAVSIVTVNSLPTVTVNSPGICPGGTANLTAGGATSYTWSSGATSTGTNTANASPGSTTSYTVTGTDGNSCINTAVSTVTVNPFPTITVNSPTICAGQTAILTGAGGSSYSWSTGAVTNAINVTPGSTTSYTVTGTVLGCSNTAVSTVTVTPNPTVTAGASPTDICPGSSSTLTAGGATTYSWSDGAGTSSSNPYPVTPAVTTTYTVTGTTGSCSATATATVNVYTVPTPVITGGPAFVGSPTTYTITPYSSSSTYTLSLQPLLPSPGTLGSLNTITGTFDVTWNSTSGGSILVDVTDVHGCITSGSADFNANNPVCTGSVIAYDTWDNAWGTPPTLSTAGPYSLYYNADVTGFVYLTDVEIVIAPGYTITVHNGANLILDGCYLHACTDMWNGIVVEPGGRIEIRNGTMIEDAVTAVNTLVTTTGTDVPNIQIDGAIFNKNGTGINLLENANDMSGNLIRDAIFTCRTLPAPSPGTFSTIKTALETNTALSLTPYPVTTTVAGPRSGTGVNMENTDMAIGEAGASVSNIFDNLDYGVYLTNANCNVVNNIFENLTGFQPVSGLPTGIGIFAPPQTPANQPAAHIGGSIAYSGNTFTECFRGIEMNNYFTIEVDNCSFNCSVTPSSFGLTPAIGANAIYLKDTPELITIRNSTMTNWETGIWITLNTLSPGLDNPGIYVEYNMIDANVDGYTSKGMFFTDFANVTEGDRIFVDNNTITDVDNGIHASNIQNNMKIYNDNIITLRYHSSGVYAGIQLDGCDLAEVKNNTILTSVTGGYDTENIDIRGIYVNASTNNRIFCNTISAVGECMVFDGNCTSTTASSYSDGNGILGNSMTDARTGLKLQNTGIIGTQGGTSFPSSNHWTSTALSYVDGQTLTLSSDPAFSLLYCLNTTASKPTNNLGAIPYLNTVTLVNVSSGSEISCPTEFVPGGGALLVRPGNELKTLNDDAAYAEELKQLLNTSLADPGHFSSSAYLMQQFIYEEVKNHARLQLDSTLNDFYTVNQETSIGMISAVNDAIRNQSYEQAAIYNTGYSAGNIIEQNHQAFNSVYLAHLGLASDYTSADASGLYAIATQCANDGGNAVNQSRNLLMFIENHVINFSEECEAQQNNRNMVLTNGAGESRTVSLYPNPNSGKMTLEYKLKEGETALVNFYSVTGKLMLSQKLSNTAKTAIDAGALENGVYMYEVLNNHKKVDAGRIVIVK